MKTIDLRQDAKIFKRELGRAVEALADSEGPLSALEFGYDCDQGGWIFIHADRRDKHQRDGEWTRYIDDGNKIEMPHWIEALEANFEGDEIELIQFDGKRVILPGFDEENESADGEEVAPLTLAVGEMIHDVVMAAKQDGVFAPVTQLGTVQLDIEDFNGGWAWPEYDDLGNTNLA